MGSALNTYNDFVAGTGNVSISEEKDVLNEVGLRSYLLKRFLKGADRAKTLQGGKRIQFSLILDEDSTFQTYQPNDTFTWRNPQVLSTGNADWRFGVDSKVWVEQEVELQANGLSEDAMFDVFVNIDREKEQRLATSMANAVEGKLFAVPNKATMEAETGSEPYSLFAFINEQTNGLFGEGAADTGTDITTTGLKWTVVHNIDPAAKSRYVPQQVAYGSTSATATGASVATRNIIQAFDEMMLLVKFEKPGTMDEYFTDPALNKQFIMASRRGVNIYRNFLRDKQDLFVAGGRQDPAFLTPKYGGIDLEYIASLDTAAVYSNDGQTGYTTEMAGAGTAEDNGPRYYWCNGNFLHPVFHKTKYFERAKPMHHPNQPFTWIQTVNLYWNIVCESRQRQGIIWPNGDIYTA